MAKFIRNQWYAAAWLSELDSEPLARRILGESVVLFRTETGTVAALLDRCPHKLAPLSMGVVEEGQIVCPYHGLRFNGAGTCTHVPAQDNIPNGAKVTSYPVAEKYGIAFIWMGDPEKADTGTLPEVKHFGEDGWGLITDGYQRHETGYLNIIENLLDPAHTTFLHRGTIANPRAAEKPVAVERGDDHVLAFKEQDSTPPSPHDSKVTGITAEKVDRGQYFYYYPPHMSLVDICVTPAGLERTEENKDKGARTLSYKFITPETEDSSHFFWFHIRNYKLGDTEWEAGLRKGLEKTYLEDNDLCREISRNQRETGDRQLIRLAIDKAPLLAVQMVERRLDAE